MRRGRARNERPAALLSRDRLGSRRLQRREPPGSACVDAGTGEGRKGQARPAAPGQAVRALHIQRIRPAGSVQAAQDRAGEERRQPRARSYPAQGAPRGLSPRVAADGRHATEGQVDFRAGAHDRKGRLPGQGRQLPRSELRSHRRNQRQRDQVEGIGPGWNGRLDRALEYFAACGRIRTKTGATQMSPLPSIGSHRFGWLARARALALAAGLVALGAGSALAQSANSLDSLSVSKASSGRTVVKFTLKAPLPNPPAGFAIANPPRIALDFPDTANGLGKTVQDIGDPALRSVNVVQAGNRTRVVFNLNKPQTYETQIEGNTVVVTLADQPGATATVEAPVVSRFAEARPGETQHALRDVDFRRGRNGEGRIIVDLSDNNTGIDIRQQGRTLVIDFLKTAVPRNLERRLDVGDFATPVATIDTFSQGGNARIVVEPRGLWEHSAYQADNRFILEVKPIQEDPNKLTQGTRQGFKGEKLSLNFQNVEVRAVLQVIADFTGLNIITSDTVTGSLTLRLKDIPWDQALDIIMQTKGLDMRKNGNVVLIAPREELAVKEKQQLEARQQISELEPLQTELFQLNYAKSSDILAIINVGARGAGGAATGTGDRFLSRRGSAFVDPRTNILFVTDIPSKLEEVRRIIRQIDTSVRQVLIESRIVIASDKFSRQLGVRFGQQTGATLFGRRYSIGSGGSLATQPVVSLGSNGSTATRTTETQTPF